MYDAWNVNKPVVESRGGVVVSQHRLASTAGAEVLVEGGNAVDAAVTTALTLGVVEPWLSGVGGGFLLYHHKASGRTHGLDFGMVAPRHLDPERYPLQGGDSPSLFGWPTVTEDRNLKGYESICVPGTVAVSAKRWSPSAPCPGLEPCSQPSARRNRGCTLTGTRRSRWQPQQQNSPSFR